MPRCALGCFLTFTHLRVVVSTDDSPRLVPPGWVYRFTDDSPQVTHIAYITLQPNSNTMTHRSNFTYSFGFCHNLTAMFAILDVTFLRSSGEGWSGRRCVTIMMSVCPHGQTFMTSFVTCFRTFYQLWSKNHEMLEAWKPKDSITVHVICTMVRQLGCSQFRPGFDEILSHHRHNSSGILSWIHVKIPPVSHENSVQVHGQDSLSPNQKSIWKAKVS